MPLLKDLIKSEPGTDLNRLFSCNLLGRLSKLPASTTGKRERNKLEQPPHCGRRPSCHGQVTDSGSPGFSLLYLWSHCPPQPLPLLFPLTLPSNYSPCGFPQSPLEGKRRDSDWRQEVSRDEAHPRSWHSFPDIPSDHPSSSKIS